MDNPPIGVLLLCGTHERAHHAFSLVTAAAALGRTVLLFASNRGCLALMADWHALDDAARDATIEARGVAGLDTLRTAARELRVRLLACETGLKAEALDPAGLLPDVEIAGLATFLHDVGDGQIIAL